MSIESLWYILFVSDDEGFEPGEIEARKGDEWEGEDEDDDSLKVRLYIMI